MEKGYKEKNHNEENIKRPRTFQKVFTDVPVIGSRDSESLKI